MAVPATLALVLYTGQSLPGKPDGRVGTFGEIMDEQKISIEELKNDNELKKRQLLQYERVIHDLIKKVEQLEKIIVSAGEKTKNMV